MAKVVLAHAILGLASVWCLGHNDAVRRLLSGDRQMSNTPVRSHRAGGGGHTYAYAFGNPLSYTDPDGLNPLLRGLAAGAGKARQIWKDLSFDGPNAGLEHGNGRVCQVRYKKQPVFRLDYHPIPGSNNESRLHFHIRSNMNRHWSIDPRSFGDGD